MNTHSKQNIHIAVAIFAPGSGLQATYDDHLAADAIAEQIYKQLCISHLDVPSELYTGHTGTGACHGGAIQNALLSFEVADLAAALSLIKQTLTTCGVSPEHYEIATCHGVRDVYASVACPEGKASALHGQSRDQILAGVKARLKERDVFIAQFSNAAIASARTLESAIEKTLESLPGSGDLRFAIPHFRALQASIKKSLETFPPYAVVEGFDDWKLAGEKFVSVPADDPSRYEAAFRELLAAVKNFLRTR
jgi:hypothetical protein